MNQVLNAPTVDEPEQKDQASHAVPHVPVANVNSEQEPDIELSEIQNFKPPRAPSTKEKRSLAPTVGTASIDLANVVTAPRQRASVPLSREGILHYMS